MANHPSSTLVAAARRFARANGYSISEGAYVGTCDDVAGTWYVDHEDDDALDRRGRGYDRQGEAWLAAASRIPATWVLYYFCKRGITHEISYAAAALAEIARIA